MLSSEFKYNLITNDGFNQGYNVLEVTIEPEYVSKVTDSYINILAQTEQMPGFRPGKVTPDAIRAKFSRKIKEKVSQLLINNFTTKTLEEAKISAGSRPALMDECAPKGLKTWYGNFGFEGDFKFSFRSPKAANIEKISIENVNLTYDPQLVEAGIDEQLLHLRHDFVIKTPTNAPSTEADEIICSLSVVDNATGKEIPSLRLKSFPFSFDLQKIDLLSGPLAEELLGKSAGENFEIQEDGFTFKVEVEQVNSKKLPELNDEFLTKHELGSMEDLRTKIREEWVIRNSPAVRREFHNRIRKELALQNDYAVPEEWIKEASSVIQNRLAEIGPALGAYEGEIEAQADLLCRSDYLLELISDSDPEKFALTEQDLLFYAREEVNNHGLTAEEYLSQLVSIGQYFPWSFGHRKTKVLDYLVQTLNQTPKLEFVISNSNEKE